MSVSSSRRVLIYVLTFVGEETVNVMRRALDAIERHVREAHGVVIVVNDYDEDTVVFAKSLKLVLNEPFSKECLDAITVATNLTLLFKYLTRVKTLQRSGVGVAEYLEYQESLNMFTKTLKRLVDLVGSDEALTRMIEDLEASMQDTRLSANDVKALMSCLRLDSDIDVLKASELLLKPSSSPLELLVGVVKAIERIRGVRVALLAPFEVAHQLSILLKGLELVTF